MYPMMSPYGPGMADQFGQDAHYGMPLLQRLAAMRTGGAMPPQQMPMPHMGGPMPPMQQNPNTGIVPPNILTGGGLPAQAMGFPRTGGAGQMQQQMPQNRLALGGGNFGMGGLLR